MSPQEVLGIARCVKEVLDIFQAEKEQEEDFSAWVKDAQEGVVDVVVRVKDCKDEEDRRHCLFQARSFAARKMKRLRQDLLDVSVSPLKGH